METKDKIIQEALDSFLTDGYEKTSISIIAKKCDVTKGSIYHHFKSKDEIFLMAIVLFYEDYENWINDRFKRCNGIKEFLYIYFDYPDYIKSSPLLDDEKNYNSYSIFIDGIKKFPQLMESLIERYNGYIDNIDRELEKAKKQDVIKKDVNCRAVATEVFILFEGLLLLDTISGKNYSFSSHKEIVFNNLWDNIRA